MAANQERWFLKSTFPVLFPTHPALTLPSDEFDVVLKTEITKQQSEQEISGHVAVAVAVADADDNFTLVSAGQSTTADLKDAMNEMGVEELSSETTTRETEDDEQSDNNEHDDDHGDDYHHDHDRDDSPTHPFIKGLIEHNKATTPEPPSMENKMFTENKDLAHRSTGSSLVDLFTSLEKTISGPHLLELLKASWVEDPMLTLKVIFNARSIHLGKAEKSSFYQCAGWLAQNHPLTLISNLRWLTRPIIEKKVEKTDEDGDTVLVEAEKDEDNITRFDVKNGVSHGYWKDLLNILALSVNGRLDVLARPEDILNVEELKGQGPKVDKGATKVRRHEVRSERHKRAVERFESDPVHRALHITVARLFAEQLKSDVSLLHSDDPKAKRRISLCAKWAPSHDRFHDRHTFIVSTIAEILDPMVGEMDRELYLRHARESYRKDISSLRHHLGVIERNLSANTLDKIKYERVPSIAMQNYVPIFDKKDKDRFDQYIDQVGQGKAKISGATLLPSTLIKTMRCPSPGDKMSKRVADAQWRTLVQRIKDSGTLESSIAVCDVSGSMSYPMFPDGTCPMDSSIGLSLLLAEVTAPPFGGSFITFSSKPQVQTFDVALPLQEKYNLLSKAEWDMTTDFVAVFEDLILPMATRNELKPEDMVKRIFVFSDMQFNKAEAAQDRWTTSFERIKKKFADAGYEMPQMMFWNLARGRGGYGGFPVTSSWGMDVPEPVVPKPVTVEEHNTATVSGYSQGMLKVFLDNGSFEEREEEQEEESKAEEIKEVGSGENAGKESSPTKRRKIDPLSTVKKAVGHKAYDMLKVVD